MVDILVVSEKYWPYGGAELATHLILKLLRNEGFKIIVLTGVKYPERLRGVKYIYTPMLNIRTKIHLWRNLLLYRNSFGKLTEQCDIVYIPRLAYPIISIAKRMKKRVVAHLHDYQPVSYEADYYSFERTHNISLLHDLAKTVRVELLNHESIKRTLISSMLMPINHLCRLWLKEADVIICVSKRQAEIIKEKMPQLTHKLKVIYNPLPKVPLTQKNVEDPVFMYLGGDSYVKGFHIFLKASYKLLERSSNVTFLLAGDFKGKNRLLIEKLNRRFKGVYSLLGHLTHEEVLKLHSVSRALVFPSISEEPLPYAILEAMLCGTIPIASKVGGIPEVVHGTYAERMLFTPGDVNGLVNRMDNVLSMSREQLIDIGVGLREAVLKRFDTENIKKHLLDIFSNKKTW